MTPIRSTRSKFSRSSLRSVSSDVLTEDDLKDFDQDHYGGTEALDTLADIAGIRRDHHVLDVCSGMGGPSRWLAPARLSSNWLGLYCEPR